MTTVTTQNPYTQKILNSYETLDSDSCAAILKSAQDSFEFYSRLDFSTRMNLLIELSRAFDLQAQPLAELMTCESGRCLKETVAEVKKTVDQLNIYHSSLSQQPMQQNLQGPYKSNQLRYDPLGVILCVMPWNYPLWQFIRALMPQIFLGNVCALKHSPLVWGSARQIVHIINSVCSTKGWPHLVFNLEIEESQVKMVIEDSAVSALSFTGSVRGGRALASLCANVLKPSVLELGGSDAYLILQDYDLEHAAQILTQARLLNMGQTCISAKRILVPAGLGDDFARMVYKQVSARKFGDPLDMNSDMGPLAHAKFALQLGQQMKEFTNLGAKLMGEVSPLITCSAHYPVQIYLNPQWHSQLAGMELFGPVFMIYEYFDLKQALQILNDTPFGLGAGIFTHQQEVIHQLIPQIKAGVVAVNDFVRTDARIPFGGIKNSGWGRELGLQGSLQFANLKTVLQS